MIFSTSYIVSDLMFRFLIHFEFISVYGVRKCSSFILLQEVGQFSQHHLLKRLSHKNNIKKLFTIQMDVHFYWVKNMHANSTRKTAERCAVHSSVQFFVTPWTVARQAPLPMGVLQASILEWVVTSFSRGSSQPGNRPGSSTLQADSLLSETSGKSRCRKRGIGLYSWWK